VQMPSMDICCHINDIPMEKLKAVFLLGTLKSSAETSNSHILSEFLAKHLKSFDTESENIRLADTISDLEFILTLMLTPTIGQQFLKRLRI
jgi:hypothetical protein